MKLNVTRAAHFSRPSTLPISSIARVAASSADRVAKVGIVGSGILCFLLLAWGHLGLGAWLFPPAATASQQVAQAGPFQVTFQSDSGQLTAGGPNTISFLVRDKSSQPIPGATIHLQAKMTTMAMDAPPIVIVPAGEGRYSAHPLFSMAGTWRLALTITQPGQTMSQDQHATFDVSVRWR